MNAPDIRGGLQQLCAATGQGMDTLQWCNGPHRSNNYHMRLEDLMSSDPETDDHFRAWKYQAPSSFSACNHK